MRRILPMLLALTLLPLRLTAQVDDEFRRFQERERRALERFASHEDSAFAAFLEREWKAFEGFASGRPYTAPKPVSPPRAPAPPAPPAPPGHMATAVRFNAPGTGDVIQVGRVTYTVADPTYIGAAVGQAMPQFRTVAPTVIAVRAPVASTSAPSRP